MIRCLSPARSLLSTRSVARCLMVLCCAGLLTACGSSQSTRPASQERSDLISILQDDGMLRSDPPALLADARALGVQVVRVSVFWAQIAPSPTSATRPQFDASDPAAYPAANWATLDTITRTAAADGIRLLFTVTGRPPLWAAGPGKPSPHNCSAGCSQWNPSDVDYGAFLAALGVRYSGHYTPSGSSTPLPRVSFWSIWNEPNYGPNLAPQWIDNNTAEVSPGIYRGLLRAAWNALAATGHTTATDTILIGETAPRGVVAAQGMVPLEFVRALYCVDSSFKPLTGAPARLRDCPATAAASAQFQAQNPGLFEASGFADHPYPQGLAPNVPTPDEPDYADFAALPNLIGTLDRAIAVYGSHVQLPIYSTEYGYKTDPPYPGGLPMATASAYLNETEYLSWLNPRIRSYDQYLLMDPSPSSGSDFDTGLRFSSGAAKPTLGAYRMPLWLPSTTGTSGTSLEVWGCARPAPALERRTGRAQSVRIQFATSAAAGFRTVATAPITAAAGCYFDTHVSFPASGLVRLAWSGAGATLYSRVQRVTLS